VVLAQLVKATTAAMLTVLVPLILLAVVVVLVQLAATLRIVVLALVVLVLLILFLVQPLHTQAVVGVDQTNLQAQVLAVLEAAELVATTVLWGLLGRLI
jgi:hypothetical protein